jgi:hypothetical protein
MNHLKVDSFFLCLTVSTIFLNALKDFFKAAYEIAEDVPLKFEDNTPTATPSYQLKTRVIDPSHIALLEACLETYNWSGEINDLNKSFSVDGKLVNNILKTNSLKICRCMLEHS